MFSNIKKKLAEPLFNRGKEQDQNGDYDSASMLYKQAIHVYPQYEEAYDRLGDDYSNLKNYQGAMNVYKKLIQMDPQDGDYYNSLGAAYSYLHDDDEREVSYYKKAISLDNSSATYYQNLGDTYNNLNNYKGMLWAYQNAVRLNPHSDEDYNYIGVAYSFLNNNRQAIINYKKAVNLNNSNVTYYQNLGTSYDNLNNYRGMLWAYQNAVRLNSQSDKDYNYIGVAYSFLNNDQQAALNYKKAINLNEKTLYYTNLAGADYDLNNYQEEIWAYRQAIRLDPKHKDDYFNRIGVAYDSMNDYSKAKACYKKACSLNNQNALYYTNIANLDNNLKEYKQTIQACNKAIKIDPNNQNAYYIQSRANYSLHRYHNEIKDLNILTRISPHNDNYYNRLGVAYYCLHDYNNACLNYQQAISYKKKPLYYSNLADSKAKLHQFGDETRALQEAIRLDPKNTKYQDRLNHISQQVSHQQSPVNNNSQHFNQNVDYMGRLNNLIGLKNVKVDLRKFINRFKVNKIRTGQNNHGEIHLVFEGAPGTGKTTVAKLFGEILYQNGVVNNDNFKSLNAADLESKYQGDSNKKVKDAIKQSMGGVLFIDEAYGMASQESSVKQAVNTLITGIENHKNDIVVILAGYTKKMEDMLNNTNPGLKSRFPYVIRFHNYSVKECYQIFQLYLREKKLSVSSFNNASGVLQKEFDNYIQVKRSQEQDQFGNARTVRNAFGRLMDNFSDRIGEQYQGHLDELKGSPKLNTITLSDVQNTFGNHNNRTKKHHDYLKDLNSLIGLDVVKNKVSSYINEIKGKKRLYGKSGHDVIHMVFEGNPGTGKTTVAELMGHILYQENIIASDRYVEINASQLESTIVGGSAKKARRYLQESMGGILFIDEAYGMAAKDSFMKQAVNTLISGIENHKHDIVVILAGYTKPMENFLNNVNPGLKSRFPTVIRFPDYTDQQCWQIFNLDLKRDHLQVDSQALPILKSDFMKYINVKRGREQDNFGNARDVRNIYELLKSFMLDRIAKLSKDQTKQLKSEGLLNVIKLDDINHSFKKYSPSQHNQHDYLKDLNSLIGLQGIKRQIRTYINRVRVRKALSNHNNHGEIHMVFEGAPGTGKTTVAKLLCKILFQKGITKSSNYEEVNAANFSSKYQGEGAEKAKLIIKKAMGGVLFIDEAYALGSKESSTRQAVDVLLSGIENHKNDLVVILAGYTKQMENLLNYSNPGLKSRFPTIVRFPNYSNAECQEIFELYMRKNKLAFDSESTKQILSKDLNQYITAKKAEEQGNFANARTVRNVYDSMNDVISNRLAKLSPEELKKVKNNQLKVNLNDVKQTFTKYGISSQHKRKPGNNAMAKLNQLIGLNSVKHKLNDYINTTKINHLIGKQNQGEIHLVFEGDPGTGKTTVAKLFAKALHENGIIKSNKVEIVEGDSLTGEYVGQTKERVKRIAQKAFGGVLFIDEAYALAHKPNEDNSFKDEAVTGLLTVAENHRHDLAIIMAGYTKPMEDFLNESNPGLKSRFPVKDRIIFPDYNSKECFQIFILMLKKQGIYLENGLHDKLVAQINSSVKKAKSKSGNEFGNARYIRNLVDGLIHVKNDRLGKLPGNELLSMKQNDPKKLVTVTSEDVDNFFNIGKETDNKKVSKSSVKHVNNDSDVKFCPKCGAKTKVNAHFCSNCGYHFKK